MVEFRLPGEAERLQMIMLYMEKYLLNPAKGLPIVVDKDVDATVLTAISKMTEGYSGREVREPFFFLWFVLRSSFFPFFLFFFFSIIIS